MYRILKPIIFLLSPENAHQFSLGCLKILLRSKWGKRWVRHFYQHPDSKLKKKICGLEFINPIGLAAGFDKNAEYIDDLAQLGFGFIEIGTVTPRPQLGNPKPRLFRLPKDKALINRMGFNSKGVEVVNSFLKQRTSKIIVGGNIGKNKTSPNTEAVKDYLSTFYQLHPYVDYLVVNVSSPNTPGLRALQEADLLFNLLESLQQANAKLEIKPIFLKISLDLTKVQLDKILKICKKVKLNGLIVANTSISREHLLASSQRVNKIGEGGLSGKPVFKKSTQMLAYVRQQLPDMILIASGGVMSGEDAIAKLKAGANLIQIYTGFVYQGPSLIKKINHAIRSYIC